MGNVTSSVAAKFAFVLPDPPTYDVYCDELDGWLVMSGIMADKNVDVHLLQTKSGNKSKLNRSHLSMASSVRIAVVGDVHDDWSLEEDSKALQLLKPDLVLFTGREKDAVQLQLECLGDEHVGYRHLDFTNIKLSIVGGRPFSCGGEQLFRKELLTARYGIHDMNESAKTIYQSALRTPEDHSVVFLAHNGPTGLGSNVDDICGRNWVIGGGDHGDPDLANAICQLKETTKLSIPLVVFGHMHKQLAYGNGLRKMIVVRDNNTVYLNGAIVPRVKRLGNEPGEYARSSIFSETSVETSESHGTIRAFTTADILDGRVEKIAETWVSKNAASWVTSSSCINAERLNLRLQQAVRRVVMMIKGYLGSEQPCFTGSRISRLRAAHLYGLPARQFLSVPGHPG
ncbi:unnamed protein product [Fraxinus pennsylvanica]|uniref:Calcineurin-like phosphoesterase domain-containing protein n=1 Tax=Fraxinus pennsylvanica TaxID=56036 RepID=A0AAD2A7U4_9LAMI|nr:unnamed protein product [Fraxinus pennsylvanica]